MNKDRLQYNAQERLAMAISGNSGVYDREGYAQTLVGAGHVPGTDAYNNMMNSYIKQNNATFSDGLETETKTSSSTKTTSKKTYNADGTLKTEMKTGGVKPTGFRRRYS